jgi:PadR family transcriptional regulator PadR
VTESRESLELLQGTLDVLILKTLSWGPRHGYAVARWLHDTSDDVLRKYYQLTSSGRQQLRFKASSWSRYAAAVSRVLAVRAG